MSKPSTLTQKLALVTGAGSGIGRATAILLGQLGARVIICDRNPSSLQETATLLQNNGVEVYSETADVSDWQAMQALAARIHNKHGALDILINNAGVATSGDFLSTPIEDWNWVFSINVMGVVHGCKAFGAAMAERGTVILLISRRLLVIMLRLICRLIPPVNTRVDVDAGKRKYKAFDYLHGIADGLKDD